MANKLISNFLSSLNCGINLLIVGISLVIILLLVYLKNNNFELFATSTTLSTNNTTTSTIPNTIPNTIGTNPVASTISLLNNDVIQNSALVNFINRFIANKNQQKVYSSTLTERQEQINNLSEQVINLINPSSS